MVTEVICLGIIQLAFKVSPLVGEILATLGNLVDGLVLHAADVAIVVVAIEDSLQGAV